MEIMVKAVNQFEQSETSHSVSMTLHSSLRCVVIASEPISEEMANLTFSQLEEFYPCLEIYQTILHFVKKPISVSRELVKSYSPKSHQWTLEVHYKIYEDLDAVALKNALLGGEE